jgi:hypothetical protein
MSTPSGAPSWRWLLVCIGMFVLFSTAYDLAGWKGWAICVAAASLGGFVGATE